MQPGKPTAAVLAASLLALGVAGAHAQDWPQWRGPNRDAHAMGFQVPSMWPKELKPTWKVTVGDGVATPSLVGDKLYVFSRENGNEVVRCLDAGSGKEIWSDKYESAGANPPAATFSGPRCSPTVVDGKVVTYGVRGILSCYDAASGKMLWRKDNSKGAQPRFAVSSSPVVVNGLVIVQVGGTGGGGITAYDLASGEEKWKWTGDSPAYSSPALLMVGGTPLVVAMTEAKMVALGAADGKLVWEAPFPLPPRGSGGMAYNAASPVIDGQTLLYTGAGRGVTAVKFDKEGEKIVAKELWKNPEKSVQYNTPVVKDGLLYGLSTTSELFCIDMKDGKTVWSGPTAPTAPPGGGAAGGGGGGGGRGGRGGRGGGMGNTAGYGSIVDAGPVLVALTPAAQLIVYKPSDKAFSEVARVPVATSATYAYPVLAGKRLIVKDNDSVALYTLQ